MAFLLLKSIIFNILLQIPRYAIFIAGTLLLIPSTVIAQPMNNIFIGTNTAGTLGYLQIKNVPMNRLYTILDIKDAHCGGFIKGYTERQANRFIVRTDVPDPRKDETHQCQVTFILNNQKLEIIKEENCNEWYTLGCSFTSLQFSPAPTPSLAPLINHISFEALYMYLSKLYQLVHEETSYYE